MTWLSKIVTTRFITDMAHIWFAAFVVSWSLHYGASWHWLIPVVVAVAAFKEYFLDARYELNQTFWDNTRDFLGYLVGMIIGFLIYDL
jgi:hypothetical protein